MQARSGILVRWMERSELELSLVMMAVVWAAFGKMWSVYRQVSSNGMIQ